MEGSVGVALVRLQTALQRLKRGLVHVVPVSRGRKYARALLAGIALAGASAAVLPRLQLAGLDPAPYLGVEASGEMLDRSGRLLHAFLNRSDQWSFPRDLDAISPHLVHATIAVEDQRFRRHPGVDPVAVLRAVWQNARSGGVRSGASTLTMQVVKQVDSGSRSLRNKLGQAVQAVRLERRATKDEILGAYLNRAPYGLNLVGCEAAARRFFGKPAKELTLPEAALLAALPKAPTALMPLEHPEAALARRDYVLTRMRREGYISQADYQRAINEPLGARWHDFPRLAPHLAMRLRPGPDGGRRLATTLDYSIQARAERYVEESLKSFDNEVTNAAVLVVDAPTASVLAWVGSADFFDTPGGGQVDACRAARSPGSALKPFTYALALERNLLYPSEMLLDDSLDYGLYNPENYDGKYRGLVSASYALRRSLNVPAVMVLNRVGGEATHGFLKRIGLSTLPRSAEYYGLGLTDRKSVV